jgi:hypothetical protein
VISHSQMAFIKGRLIHKGALALYEIKSKKKSTLILKLHFEKAYDRVSWPFLREVLTRKVFKSRFIHRIMQLVCGGKTAICINGKV